jgi:translation initiation factor IF-2
VNARATTPSPVDGAAPSTTGPCSDSGPGSAAGTTVTGQHASEMTPATSGSVAGTTSASAPTDRVRSVSTTTLREPRRGAGRPGTAPRTAASASASPPAGGRGPDQPGTVTWSAVCRRRAAAAAQRSAARDAGDRSAQTTTEPVMTTLLGTGRRQPAAAPCLRTGPLVPPRSGKGPPVPGREPLPLPAPRARRFEPLGKGVVGDVPRSPPPAAPGHRPGGGRRGLPAGGGGVAPRRRRVVDGHGGLPREAGDREHPGAGRAAGGRRDRRRR